MNIDFPQEARRLGHAVGTMAEADGMTEAQVVELLGMIFKTILHESVETQWLAVPPDRREQ